MEISAERGCLCGSVRCFKLWVTGSDLSTTLSLVSGVTINAISDFIKRLEQGEEISDDAICDEVQSAIEENRIQESLVANNDALAMLGGLFRRFDLLGYAVTDNGRAIQERLAEMLAKYDGLVNEINEGISEIHTEISEIREPVNKILVLLESSAYATNNSLESRQQYLQFGQTSQFINAGEPTSVNIPEATNFVGRDTEISEIDDLIKQQHLLIIWGLLGSGRAPYYLGLPVNGKTMVNIRFGIRLSRLVLHEI